MQSVLLRLLFKGIFHGLSAGLKKNGMRGRRAHARDCDCDRDGE